MAFQTNKNLPALKLVVVLLCLGVLLGGCVDKTPVPPPSVTRDLGVTEKFTLTLTIGEPGVFDRIEVYANYSISNRSECVPMDHSIALGGVRHIALEKVDLTVKQVGESKFRADALQHPFVAEDYYALGVCRWAISSVSFRIHNSGMFQTVTMGPDESKKSDRKDVLCFLNPHRNGMSCRSYESISQGNRHLMFPVTIESHKD